MIHFNTHPDKEPKDRMMAKSLCGYKGTGTYTRDRIMVECKKCITIIEQTKHIHESHTK